VSREGRRISRLMRWILALSSLIPGVLSAALPAVTFNSSEVGRSARLRATGPFNHRFSATYESNDFGES
jgi:hypothetical protein